MRSSFSWSRAHCSADGSGGGGGGTSEVLNDQGGGGGAGRHAGIGGEDDGPSGTSFAQDGTIDTGGKSNFSIAAGGDTLASHALEMKGWGQVVQQMQLKEAEEEKGEEEE